MTARVQHRRSMVAGAALPNLPMKAGELAINVPDQQIFSATDTSGTPIPLIGVRIWSLTSSYKAGDLVARQGQVYSALTDLAPKGFDPADWQNMATASTQAMIDASLAAFTMPVARISDSTIFGQNMVKAADAAAGRALLGVNFPIPINQGGTGATTAAGARANLGIYNADGSFSIGDGSVGAPGLAFAAEPGFGWYRKTAGMMAVAEAGKEVWRLDASAANSTYEAVWPRAAGSTGVSLYNNAAGTANMQSLFLGISATQAMVVVDRLGSAAALPLNFAKASGYVFDNYVQANGAGGGFTLGGYWMGGSNYWVNALAANPNWGPMFLRGLHIPGQYAGWRMGSDIAQAYIDYQLSGDSGVIVCGGPSSIVQAAIFRGKADSAGYADGAGYSNNSGAVNGIDINGIVRSDGAQFAGFISGGQVPYFRRTADNGVYRLATLQNIGWQTFDGSVAFSGQINPAGDIRCRGGNSHTYQWFWNGDAGDAHFYAFVDGSNQGWVAFNSDARIKTDIAPLELDVDTFMALQPASFRLKDTELFQGYPLQHGFIAQQIETAYPVALIGSTTAVDDEGNPFPASVDYMALIAQTVLMVQDIQRRLTAMEAA